MGEITAKIIADSISPSGVRLTTMELNYPRFIHSEFMTHRMFSRNASSSRAIPIEKMLKQVQENPAFPIHWGKTHPGMHAREEVEHPVGAYREWIRCSIDAIESAEFLLNYGLHKQIVNRVLEPFQYIKVIVTATEWDNFFKLRLHADAQPEIYELARCMKVSMEDSIPNKLEYGEWHAPYVEWDEFTMSMFRNKEDLLETKIKCSVARCARVSYLNHDNSSPDIEKDLQLAAKLLEAGHLSPFEHIATPMPTNVYSDRFEFDCEWVEGITHIDRGNVYWSGNFKSWIQHRQLLSAV